MSIERLNIMTAYQLGIITFEEMLKMLRELNDTDNL